MLSPEVVKQINNAHAKGFTISLHHSDHHSEGMEDVVVDGFVLFRGDEVVAAGRLQTKSFRTEGRADESSTPAVPE